MWKARGRTKTSQLGDSSEVSKPTGRDSGRSLRTGGIQGEIAEGMVEDFGGCTRSASGDPS